MVFNTGAALLDAIVLAVVSNEKDGTYGYKITQDVRSVLEVSESSCIRCCGDCRRMNVWRHTIRLLQAETADIIKSQKKAWHIEL